MTRLCTMLAFALPGGRGGVPADVMPSEGGVRVSFFGALFGAR